MPPWRFRFSRISLLLSSTSNMKPTWMTRNCSKLLFNIHNYSLLFCFFSVCHNYNTITVATHVKFNWWDPEWKNVKCGLCWWNFLTLSPMFACLIVTLFPRQIRHFLSFENALAAVRTALPARRCNTKLTTKTRISNEIKVNIDNQ